MGILIIVLAAIGILAALLYSAWRILGGDGGWKRLGRIVTIVSATGFIAIQLAYPTVVKKYRLTYEVEADGQSLVFSTVQKIRFSLEPCPTCNRGGSVINRRLEGEAVVMDLGKRGRLYALLALRGPHYNPQSFDTSETFARALGPDPQSSGGNASYVRGLGSASGKTDVPAGFAPFLVRFRDEKDPSTVEAVDPTNLVASFGEGVSLKRATIETVPAGFWPLNLIVDMGEPVTREIDNRLVWLLAHKGMLVNANRIDLTHPERNLTSRDFSVGRSK